MHSEFCYNRAKSGRRRRHAKAFMADRRVVVMGSASATYNGFERRCEIVARIEGQQPCVGFAASLWPFAACDAGGIVSSLP